MDCIMLFIPILTPDSFQVIELIMHILKIILEVQRTNQFRIPFFRNSELLLLFFFDLGCLKIYYYLTLWNSRKWKINKNKKENIMNSRIQNWWFDPVTELFDKSISLINAPYRRYYNPRFVYFARSKLYRLL